MISKIVQLLKDPTKKHYIKDIATRIALYAISFVEILALPILLDEKVYGEFEYLKNAVFLFPMFLIGGHSGFTYMYYREKVDWFQSLVNIGLILTVFASIGFAWYYNNIYVILPCIAINIFSILEQKLKIKKRFVIAFLFKPLISLLAIVFSGLYFLKAFPNGSSNTLLNFVFSGAMAIWLIFIINDDKSLLKVGFRNLKKDFSNYSIFVKKIFTGVLATIFVNGFFFLERYYVNKFYPEELADYSFSFNLVQLLIILITTLSYISSNLLGEKLFTIQKAELWNYFKMLLAGFVFLVLGLIVFSKLLQIYIFPHFEYMTTYTSILGVSKGFLFLVGILTPLAVYNDFNNRMLVIIGTLFILSNVAAYFVDLYGLSITQYLLLNGVIIFMYPLLNLDIIFKRIVYGQKEKPING